MRSHLTAIVCVATAATLAAQPNPFSWPGFKLPNGERFEFQLHMPDGVTPENPCPVALVFVDGKQSREEVWNTLAWYFWMQAPKERLGVFLPVAPEAGPFHKSGFDGVRHFVQSLRGKTRLEGNGLHAVGMLAEGASSAFEMVRQWPHQFASITLVVSKDQEPPPALPADVRYQHLRLVVLAPEMDAGPLARWKETIAAWKERGFGAESRPCPTLAPTSGEHRAPSSIAEALWDALRTVTAAPEIPAAEVAIHACLDRWHSAAARTDQETYWSLWQEDGVFLPPGGVERWTVAQFRKRAAASFAKPPGWTFVPVQRWIRVSDDGKSAWVEESLGCFEHGTGRGIGLLTRREDGWRILRYAVTGFPEGAVTDAKR